MHTTPNNYCIAEIYLETGQLDDLNQRLTKLEKQSFQDLLALLEILSNATFFGEMKKNCDFAKEGQCTFFFIEKETKNKLPLATACRIKDCKDTPGHYHVEQSNLTCSLCPLWRNARSPEISADIRSK
jgi:hypothetical protein